MRLFAIFDVLRIKNVYYIKVCPIAYPTVRLKKKLQSYCPL